jgi:hypothetical protein
LVVTIGDSMFEPGNGSLRAVASQPLANLAAVLSSHPGLSVRVEGYADTGPLSDERARAVQTALIVSGAAPPGLISAVGYGNSRPIAPQATAAGREQNRRVEVVIYGDSIGNHALWDHPYSLRSQADPRGLKSCITRDTETRSLPCFVRPVALTGGGA